MLDSLDHGFIREQVALLRQHCSLPIIFTVRSKGQGGKFSGEESQYFSLLDVGFRLGCEFIDVEACWSCATTDVFVSRISVSCRIISSYHDYNISVTETHVKELLAACLRLSESCCRKDRLIPKVVMMAHNHNDAVIATLSANSANLSQPYIVICAGEAGKISRVMNWFMTPVSHPKLPSVAASG